MLSYVESCMTRSPATCHEDEDLTEAMALMEKRQVRRIPVLNDRKEVTGILSLADVARRAEEAESGRVLRGVSSAD